MSGDLTPLSKRFHIVVLKERETLRNSKIHNHFHKIPPEHFNPMLYIQYTPNIIVNARHTWLQEYAVCALLEKLRSDGGDWGIKKCK
jgi:hypothetical protein